MSAMSVMQLVSTCPSATAILDTDNGIRDVAGTNQGSESAIESVVRTGARADLRNDP